MQVGGRILAIGLDAADARWVRRWIASGDLPHLAHLAQNGSFVPLESDGKILEDSVWPSFYTGVGVGTHGHYMYQQVRSGTQRLEPSANGAYRRPFWSLLPTIGRRAIVVDVPKTLPLEADGLIQVIGWGEKSGQLRVSRPAGLLGEIEQRFGRRSGAAEQFHVRSAAHEARILRSLEQSIGQCHDLTRFLLQEEPWDLALVVFSESHTAGHQFYPSISSVRLGHWQGEQLWRALKTIYRRLDDAVGDLVAAVPPDTDILVFSVHGMEQRPDVRSLTTETLRQLGFAPTGASSKRNPFQLARELVPLAVRDLVNSLLPESTRRAVEARLLETSCDWGSTRAFSEDPSQGNLPYVRINLRGREAQGIVEPDTYDRVCDELVRELKLLRVHPSGEHAVAEVWRVRSEFPGPHAEELPDLIIHWSPAVEIAALAHPRVGIIQGGAPTLQSARHASQGFVIAQGPRFHTAATADNLEVRDLAPTLLYLLGSEIPEGMEGRVCRALIAPEVLAAQPIQVGKTSWDQEVPW